MALIEEDPEDAGEDLAEDAEEDPQDTGEVLAEAAARDGEKTGEALAVAAGINPQAVGEALAVAADKNPQATGEALATAANKDPQATGEALAAGAEKDPVATGEALTAAAVTDAKATGEALAYAAETNAKSTGEALATAVDVDPVAIGEALITSLKRKAEPIAEALKVAAKTNAGGVQAALESGPAKDPEAREILARVLPSISWVPQYTTQPGPDPAGGGVVLEAILVSTDSQRSPIERVLVKFPASRPDPKIRVEVIRELPTEVPVASKDRIVSDYVEISAENFVQGELLVAQVTLSVEKAWLEANNVHQWSIEFSRFDETKGKWKPALANRIGEDAERILYSLVVTEFSLWSITGSVEPPPVIFRVDDLDISPKKLNEGEAVTIEATVTNLSDQQAEYVAVLWLNAGLNSSQTLVLEGNESGRASFTLSPKIGTYDARVDQLLGEFTVRAPGAGLFGVTFWIIIAIVIAMVLGGFWWFLIALRRRRRKNNKPRRRIVRPIQ